eukprot:9294700-Lingulodinium_polyedra.AAC.1
MLECKNRIGRRRAGSNPPFAPPPGLRSPTEVMQPRVGQFLISFEFGVSERGRRVPFRPEEVMDYLRASL